MESDVATKPDDDELEITPDMEVDPPENPDDDPDSDPENPDDEGEETPIVSFEGDEPPEPEPDNSTIRTMRQQLREKEKRIAELEKATAPKPVEVGPKPGLWDDDIAGDEDIYDKRLLDWNNRKAAVDRQTEQQAEEARAARESWDQACQRYKAKVAEYGFGDISEDEALVEAALGINSPVILKAANDPALMIRALGRNPAKLAELAKLKDPFEIAAAVARMEGAVKVTNRKAPAPDKPLRGSASMPGGGDKELEKLEKEAARTGDRTKLIKYKTELADKK